GRGREGRGGCVGGNGGADRDARPPAPPPGRPAHEGGGKAEARGLPPPPAARGGGGGGGGKQVAAPSDARFARAPIPAFPRKRGKEQKQAGVSPTTPTHQASATSAPSRARRCSK